MHTLGYIYHTKLRSWFRLARRTHMAPVKGERGRGRDHNAKVISRPLPPPPSASASASALPPAAPPPSTCSTAGGRWTRPPPLEVPWAGPSPGPGGGGGGQVDPEGQDPVPPVPGPPPRPPPPRPCGATPGTSPTPPGASSIPSSALCCTACWASPVCTPPGW